MASKIFLSFFEGTVSQTMFYGIFCANYNVFIALPGHNRPLLAIYLHKWHIFCCVPCSISCPFYFIHL